MKAKTAVLTITPPYPTDMGAGARASQLAAPYETAEPLEANLLALWPNQKTPPILFVSLDLLYPGDLLRSAIEKAAPALSPDRIFIGASHTHRAPMTDDSKPHLGLVSDEYIAWLQGELASAVTELLAYDHAMPVQLLSGTSMAAHSVNRRRKKLFLLAKRPRFNFIANAPNPSGTTDEMVSALTVLSENGTELAYIWNYACHPVGHPSRLTYSSHFPHHVRVALRDRADNPKAAVLYFQGFSGNTRPSASVGVRSVKERLRRLVSGPLFDDMSPRGYARWTASLASVVKQAVDAAVPLVDVDFQAKRTFVDSLRFASSLSRPVSFQHIRLSSDFALIGVSAEVVAEYAHWVRESIPFKVTMCVGCIDHTFGYIPTSQMLIEGGYESGGYTHAFGIDALNKDIEVATKDGIREVTSSSWSAS